MESLSSKPFFVAILFIVLAICSYMNSSLAATPNQLSSEFFTTTIAFPNSPTTHDNQIKEKAFATDIITTSVALNISPTTGDSRINEKAFATKIITTSAAPVPNSPTAHDTRINEKVSMTSALTLLRRELLKGYSNPSAPSPDTYIPDSTNHKAAPAPSPEFSLLRRKLLKGYTPPSAPSPDTYIPASASTLANHKTAPFQRYTSFVLTSLLLGQVVKNWYCKTTKRKGKSLNNLEQNNNQLRSSDNENQQKISKND